jgi:protein-S-isoprenylcysteine O-methyltransferase Ste14
MKWLELKVPPLAVTLVFGGFIWIIPGSHLDIESNITYSISIGVFLLGSVIAVLGVWEFKKHKTTVNPMSPEECNSLVVKGVYRLTRNPMYLGFLLWLCALGLFLIKPLSLAPILGFIFYMNYFQILPEERVLTDHFGQGYVEYKSAVRRWI